MKDSIVVLEFSFVTLILNLLLFPVEISDLKDKMITYQVTGFETFNSD